MDCRPKGQPLTSPKQHPEPIFRGALVRTHRWMQQLKTGQVTMINELTAQDSIASKGKISGKIQLLSLSSAIQEAILTGESLGFLILEESETFSCPVRDKTSGVHIQHYMELIMK